MLGWDNDKVDNLTCLFLAHPGNRQLISSKLIQIRLEMTTARDNSQSSHLYTSAVIQALKDIHGWIAKLALLPQAIQRALEKLNGHRMGFFFDNREILFCSADEQQGDDKVRQTFKMSGKIACAQINLTQWTLEIFSCNFSDSSNSLQHTA